MKPDVGPHIYQTNVSTTPSYQAPHITTPTRGSISRRHDRPREIHIKTELDVKNEGPGATFVFAIPRSAVNLMKHPST